jgi:hypothetical protein
MVGQQNYLARRVNHRLLDRQLRDIRMRYAEIQRDTLTIRNSLSARSSFSAPSAVGPTSTWLL